MIYLVAIIPIMICIALVYDVIEQENKVNTLNGRLSENHFKVDFRAFDGVLINHFKGQDNDNI